MFGFAMFLATVTVAMFLIGLTVERGETEVGRMLGTIGVTMLIVAVFVYAAAVNGTWPPAVHHAGQITFAAFIVAAMTAMMFRPRQPATAQLRLPF